MAAAARPTCSPAIRPTLTRYAICRRIIIWCAEAVARAAQPHVEEKPLLFFRDHTQLARPVLSMTEVAIRADRLTKRYGDTLAVDGVDLLIQQGRFFRPARPQWRRQDQHDSHALNVDPPDFRRGVGKRTFRAYAQRLAVRRSIGVVFQEPALDRTLTVAENLRFAGLLNDLSRPEIRRRSAEVAGAVRVERKARSPGRIAFRRNATRTRHRARRDPPAADPVSRRTDHRPGPAQPTRHLAPHRAAPGPARHYGAPDDPLSRGSCGLRRSGIPELRPHRPQRSIHGRSSQSSAPMSSRSRPVIQRSWPRSWRRGSARP